MYEKHSPLYRANALKQDTTDADSLQKFIAMQDTTSDFLSNVSGQKYNDFSCQYY